MDEERDRIDTQDFRFTSNRNINYIIVRNISKDEDASINVDDYLPLLKSQGLCREDSNCNTNVIIIQNIITDDTFMEGSGIKDIPGDDDETRSIEQSSNNNVNFVVIRNIIPLKKYFIC